jgi:hypothetical protein
MAEAARRKHLVGLKGELRELREQVQRQAVALREAREATAAKRARGIPRAP